MVGASPLSRCGIDVSRPAICKTIAMNTWNCLVLQLILSMFYSKPSDSIAMLRWSHIYLYSIFCAIVSMC